MSLPSSGATAPGSKRRARERALELLYEAECRGEDAAGALARCRIAPDPYAVALVEGVHEHLAELDSMISARSESWTVERMPAVDRTLLRLGLYELMHRPDVPTGVVLSEAADLATEFSTDRSAPFVNGILAKLAGEVRDPA